MSNQENMNIELKRTEVLDVRMAILGIIIDANEELNDENTSEDRKEILKGTIKKWTTLREKIIEQFKEQDK